MLWTSHTKPDIILPSTARAFYNFMMENTTSPCLVNSFNPNNRGWRLQSFLRIIASLWKKIQSIYHSVRSCSGCLWFTCTEKTQNHWIVNLKGLWQSPSPPSLFRTRWAIAHCPWRCAHGILNISKDGDSATSSGNLLQCLNSKKMFFLYLIGISYILISAYSLLGLSLGTTEKSGSVFLLPAIRDLGFSRLISPSHFNLFT